ncbi:FtsX-like permease family protein [Peribacillus sp. NPDC097295]|uniref:FtsX-like permease family protein n=1 Tax=Peribacillus sp. NPDC097295 TaxID=3364402 RepID=UPI0038279938
MAAGIIPVFGWGAKAAKAGVVAYKATKGLNAADHMLDAYKSTKAMDILKQTEAGLYGLSAANGLGEAVTGKDMFGNELTEEQRQTSLMTALGITGIAGAAKAADKMASGTKLIPYSKEYVQNKVQKAQGTIKDMGKAIGKVEVPTGVKVRTVADSTGNTYKAIGVDKTTIKDLAQKITAKGEGSKGTGKVYPTRQIDSVAEAHIVDRVKELRGNLPSKYKKAGNYALAEVDVNGINKKEFYASNQFGVMKALGASTGYLAKSIVGQVFMLAVVCIASSVALTYGVTFIMPEGMPFELSTSLVIQYSILLLIVSVLGSLLSLYRVSKIDAIEAIGRVA